MSEQMTTLSGTDPETSRLSRRRDRTRERLVRATQELVAEQGTAVSVGAIAERADVALQTLYNHGGSKAELLALATTAAIADIEVYLTARSASCLDPLERFAVQMRLYGRLPDSHPLYARLLVRTAPDIVGRRDGYAPRAYAEVTRLISVGRLRCDDVALVLMTAFAAFERLLAVRLQDPTVGSGRSDDLAALVLTLLGLPADEAHALVGVPLPADPNR